MPGRDTQLRKGSLHTIKTDNRRQREDLSALCLSLDPMTSPALTPLLNRHDLIVTEYFNRKKPIVY